MAITDQLKALYVKLGGDPNTGASNIEEWIDKIEDVAGSGSGSGGTGISSLMVQMTTNPDNGRKTLEYEAGALYNFINDGGVVYVYTQESNARFLYLMIGAATNGETYIFYVSGTGANTLGFMASSSTEKPKYPVN